MSIRRAILSDSKTLSELVLESALTVRESDFTNDGWRLLESTNTVEAVQRRIESPSYFALIYEIDGIIAGYIGMVDFEKIDHMFVLSQYRRMGVSKKLWARAQEICAESGKGTYYWVRSSSYAEPVYVSFGFLASCERESTRGISFRLMERGKIPNS